MRKIDIEKERVFENQKTHNENIRRSQSKYYWAVELARVEHMRKTIDIIQGSRVLEIGCSKGENAAVYSLSASSYVGIDISDAAIECAKKRNIQNAEFLCVDGHMIPYEDESFDFVVVNSLLHHLDLSRSLIEISRILVKGGRLIFIEPLGINPLFLLYRSFTPNARTQDERPFNLADLKLIQTYFYFDNPRFSGFTSLISSYVKSTVLRFVFTSFDDLLARTPIKYLFWQISGIARKVKM